MERLFKLLDSTLPFQLSFINHRSRPESRYSVNISMQEDEYNGVRQEYVEMLENQIAKSNNGIVRTKLLTFGVNVDDLSTARGEAGTGGGRYHEQLQEVGRKICRSLRARTFGTASRPAPPERE